MVTRSEADPLVLAHFWPQFHPVVENDVFWGDGFTDWRGVVACKPRVEGHEPSVLPGELGFYDLRLAAVRDRQAALAEAYGVDGFLWFHYWFGGRRVLEEPFEAVLRSGRPDFPFCLCWANEDWDGADRNGGRSTYVRQIYSAADDDAHAAYLARAFSDSRYVRLNGRPLFFIYRAYDLPAPHRFVSALGRACAEVRVEAPYLVQFEVDDDYSEPANRGFDGAAQFVPHVPLEVRLAAQDPTTGSLDPTTLEPAANASMWDYETVAAEMVRRPVQGWPSFPSVAPAWDNTPRQQAGRALILAGSSPDGYERWLTKALQQQVDTQPVGQRVVLVNAWNRWAEAAVLEPSLPGGRAHLEATARAVANVTGRAFSAPPPGETSADWSPEPPVSSAERVRRAQQRLAALDYVEDELHQDTRRRIDAEVRKLQTELADVRSLTRAAATELLTRWRDPDG